LKFVKGKGKWERGGSQGNGKLSKEGGKDFKTQNSIYRYALYKRNLNQKEEFKGNVW